MRFLLTGAGGFVGTRILTSFSDRYSVSMNKAAVSDGVSQVIACPSLRGCNQAQIAHYIEEIRPDVIIHTAAISDTGVCERDPAASYGANVVLPEMLARAARTAKLIIFSSDQVYNGCEGEGPYVERATEIDGYMPVNVYGRHKLEMERRVLAIQPDAVLLRATWMYDMPVFGSDNRGNFLVNTMKAAMTNQPVSYSGRQYRGLTYVREAAEQMEKLAAVPGGVYNFGSENDLNMYETAGELLKLLGAGSELLQEGEARHNLWMDCSKLREYGIEFSSTIDGLKSCLSDYAW